MKLKKYEIEAGYKLATLLEDVHAIDEADSRVTVGKKGDTVKVFQVFNDTGIAFIGCKGWDWEVTTNKKNIYIIKCSCDRCMTTYDFTGDNEKYCNKCK